MFAFLLLAGLPFLLSLAFSVPDFSGEEEDPEPEPEPNSDVTELAIGSTASLISLLDASAITVMEEAFATDEILSVGLSVDAAEVEAAALDNFTDAELSFEQGTPEEDTLGIEEDGGNEDFVLGLAADDLILGSDNSANEDRIDGGEGDDILVGRGGADVIRGGDGNDIISGGLWADILTGRNGSDLIFGGNGADTIYDNGDEVSETAPNSDTIIAGNGADLVRVSDGTNLVSLGAGADLLKVFSDQTDADTSAIVTDFEPGKDAIQLYVDVGTFTNQDEYDVMVTDVILETVTTDIGTGTLVTPVVNDPALAATLEGNSVPYAFLLGISPEQLEGGDVFVAIRTPKV